MLVSPKSLDAWTFLATKSVNTEGATLHWTLLRLKSVNLCCGNSEFQWIKYSQNVTILIAWIVGYKHQKMHFNQKQCHDYLHWNSNVEYNWQSFKANMQDKMITPKVCNSKKSENRPLHTCTYTSLKIEREVSQFSDSYRESKK